MNSYPPELLAQLAPVMFVAGLDAPSAPSSQSPPTPTTAAEKPQDAFQVLTSRLREALLAQRKVAIWQPEKNKSFQVILVGKDVKFPPRKLIPPEDPQYSAAHSPLSPLTPTSPLHPDGLIAPIWIRKHTSLVPSVFVLFLRIYEHPPHASRNPLDLPDAEKERERESEERRRDAELATDVAQRKKVTNDRGIKLTVVLMASRRMLDDPSLDGRLTYIRRQSGLDSRAALFVLSPVSSSELNEFVRSLQQALYEPAIEYYTAHSKRVRRKRNRHSQNVSSYPNPVAGLGTFNIARPLRPEGWTVRYEYKMACFAEFRSEDEVALKHYQDAYGMLIIMFGSTAILPPRTKRWAEAKVLADCINIKIVKLYLYNNEHALALSHHNTHIRQFGDFSRGWGIGEETFEFWSWVARQHRILGELLEQGTRSTLVIPVHKPPAAIANLSQSQATLRTMPGVEYDAMRSLGLNPSHALQHPGFYYYVAARCTEMRRSRFMVALNGDLSQKQTALSPGFTNEKKVEHLSIINELYTKAYELFKKHSPASNQGQGRLTLWIAYRIAQTYYEAGKFDMAVRFFERIARTYRRERWSSMLLPLLSTWYACAQQLGDVELSIKLLIEILAQDAVHSDDPSSYEEDLLAVLKSTVPSSPKEPLVVDLIEAQPIFNSDVVFWAPDAKVGEQAAFQVTLTAPKAATVGALPFARVAIYFSGRDAPVVVEHAPPDAEGDAGQSGAVNVVQLGALALDDSDVCAPIKADLRWPLGGAAVFLGSIAASAPTVLKVTSIVVTIEENQWVVEMPFEPCTTRSVADAPSKWLSSIDPPKFIPIQREEYRSTTVKHRAHLLKTSLSHHAPAYLDEDYPIELEVTNMDNCELDVVVSFLLQPTEIDSAVNWIIVDDQRSPSLIKGIHLGVLAPGVSAVKTIHLFNTGAGGDRMIDISITTRSTTDPESNDDDGGEAEEEETTRDEMEHLKMLVVPTVAPLQVIQSVAYRRALGAWSGLADLTTFDDSYWDSKRGGEAVASASITCVGPWGVVIDSVELERQDNARARILDSSSDLLSGEASEFPAEFIEGDEFSASCRISFILEEAEDAIDGPGRYAITWCRVLKNGDHGAKSITHCALPSLRPPRDNLVALLDVPPKATLHAPILMTLTIRNYHPTRAANVVVQLEPDSLDGFVVAGVRNGRVPVLLPGAEEVLVWRVVPIECGYLKLPRVKVVDRRRGVPHAEGGATPETAPLGEVIKVVDLRRDARLQVANTEGATEAEVTILVLP
ncbi:hypothetical protein HYPSUDRAFT_33253 [Hypholoma sublateritium FD-334 SS-4]|uniref:Trafficking protein particle complex subunit 11 domain-containing protein n=1 Tax=Hypholoma sublateritium (strain FD-334 SS-4) TaxID=945553 RepID=A0A0D2MXP9_HYPSF|nr:hypothetical protein HYPSUDRAFT_33253 [Hypholoma sublateritium FD-334 SS-4]